MSASKKDAPEKARSQPPISNDPFHKLYPKGIFCYGIFIIFVLLWPFDFSFLYDNNVKWAPDAGGVIFDAGQIVSTVPGESLHKKILTGNGLSIALWVSSAIDNQTGPARIMSYSADPLQRNFTVAQEKDGLVVRLRTVYTDDNGLYPHIKLPGVFSSKKIQYIVITYDIKELSIFINGTLQLRQPAPTGGFENWDPSYHLIFGNEATGNRPWAGRIYYAAIYNRPLAENEISQQYTNGWRFHEQKKQEDLRADAGIVARYFFNEGKGKRIQDSSSISNPLDLAISPVIQSQNSTYLAFRFELSDKDLEFWKDVVLNIVAFIPLGFLFHAFLRMRFGITLSVSASVLLVGGVLTISVESLQYFSVTRTSSMLDVINNLLGVILGIALDRFYADRLEIWRRALYNL